MLGRGAGRVWLRFLSYFPVGDRHAGTGQWRLGTQFSFLPRGFSSPDQLVAYTASISQLPICGRTPPLGDGLHTHLRPPPPLPAGRWRRARRRLVLAGFSRIKTLKKKIKKNQNFSSQGKAGCVVCWARISGGWGGCLGQNVVGEGIGSSGVLSAPHPRAARTNTF